MLVIDQLIRNIRNTSDAFNRDIQVAPACVLWPDKDCQWEAAIETLLPELPELFMLGQYNPERHTGPAIWLRYMLARKTDETIIPPDKTPIIYLPKVSRQELRDVENISDSLKPLAELQYRGVIWSQINSKDWTVLAFLKSSQGGLNLDVALDNQTKDAMLLALDPLLDKEIENLRGKKLDKDFFYSLLESDYARSLLKWLDQQEIFKSSKAENKWQAFIKICKSDLHFDPENDGILTGAKLLASHNSMWKTVWERFREAPKRYPNIPRQIRKCKPPTNNIDWWNPSNTHYEGWPQWNESQENALRKDLEYLDQVTPSKARKQILDLEKEHKSRRNLIWTELGESPLAEALEYLAVMAKITSKALNAGKLDDISIEYQNNGWKADESMLNALSFLEKREDIDAITKAIRAIYLPWAQESARYLQKIVDQNGYPNDSSDLQETLDYKNGECILFVDGLRFDLAKSLIRKLEDIGLQTKEEPKWVPLPTVTATGKAAATPIPLKISGKENSTDFEPCVADSEKPLKNYQLKKLLTSEGWQILDSTLAGNVSGKAWHEFGDIDHKGHQQGWKLVRELDSILKQITDQVKQLLDLGWKKVHIVTDHGWLLLPGNLPKTELPLAQAQTKWGRCATIKPGAITEERFYPWYWNKNQHFALADGISCFRNGVEYDHGGLSLQECLTLKITVTQNPSRISHIIPEITKVEWRGLRCKVSVDSVFEGLTLDIRTQPGNPKSSVVNNKNQLNKNRTASVIVENEELEGTAAVVVLLNQKGELVTQTTTVIGEE